MKTYSHPNGKVYEVGECEGSLCMKCCIEYQSSDCLGKGILQDCDMALGYNGYLKREIPKEKDMEKKDRIKHLEKSMAFKEDQINTYQESILSLNEFIGELNEEKDRIKELERENEALKKELKTVENINASNYRDACRYRAEAGELKQELSQSLAQKVELAEDYAKLEQEYTNAELEQINDGLSRICDSYYKAYFELEQQHADLTKRFYEQTKANDLKKKMEYTERFINICKARKPKMNNPEITRDSFKTNSESKYKFSAVGSALVITNREKEHCSENIQKQNLNEAIELVKETLGECTSFTVSRSESREDARLNTTYVFENFDTYVEITVNGVK